MLTAKDIEQAKHKVKYCTHQDDIYHENHDCVRIAIKWLEAQTRIKTTRTSLYGIKKMVEAWAGRYVSRSDVELAAHILQIPVKNYYIAISGRFVLPSQCRLDGIKEAHTQSYKMRPGDIPRFYNFYEVELEELKSTKTF